jgi:hypothetical protein
VEGRGVRAVLLPEQFPGVGAECHDSLLLDGGDPVRELSPVDLLWRGPAEDHVEVAVALDDLLRQLGPGVSPERLPGRRVEADGGAEHAQRRIDPVPGRDESPMQIDREHPALRVVVRLPRGQRPAPEHDAVERVSRDQVPSRGQHAGEPDGPFVDHVEQPAACRDHGVHRRQHRVGLREPRPGDPLRVHRRVDDRVVRDGVAVCIVQEVGPLVDPVVERLAYELPAVPVPQARRAARPQHAEDLAPLRPAGVLADDQVHQIVDVGEMPPGMGLDGDLPAEPGRADAFARGLDLGGVPVQAAHDVALARVKCNGEFACAAAEVDREPSPDPRGVQERPGALRGICDSFDERTCWRGTGCVFRRGRGGRGSPFILSLRGSLPAPARDRQRRRQEDPVHGRRSNGGHLSSCQGPSGADS